MSDSIGMVDASAAAVPTRPKDSNGFEIHSKEERIAAWNQSQMGAAARKAVPSLWLSDMPPARCASMEAAMARSAEALRRAQEGGSETFFRRIKEYRVRQEEGNPTVAPPATESMMTRLAGIRTDYENKRRDLLGLLVEGGLMDLVRSDINDEAADAMSVQLRDTVHDLDRRLGRRPTDLSGRYPTSEENPFNLVL